ncbi:MAG: hypothetical protein OMM_13655 [Candidatus Magnetoglobus multicellularis str. Araruama]|uniref:Uncharacterized protein n=1 Tax=Candidatus Magnetoglobus multicellularis str. Araruama TaxID=890399 RepID=A0A1V1NTC4_9BACT|nr:MAG: hypothetical protein OMM_13655 [Candidatus Magnetoglobus multicellularis str. Araruama]
MLHYDTGIKLENESKTDYMGLQSFRNRSILPKPSQVASVKIYQNVMARLKQGEVQTVSEKEKLMTNFPLPLKLINCPTILKKLRLILSGTCIISNGN